MMKSYDESVAINHNPDWLHRILIIGGWWSGKTNVRKNIFDWLFSSDTITSLSRHEQVCLMTLRFERYLSDHGNLFFYMNDCL